MTYERRIGRFQVKRRLGHGFAGDVHLVFDPDYNREVALKVITSVDTEVLEAERRGAEIQEQLSREVPQIARIFEKGNIEGRFFIAMEYVAGDDLSELLHGPLPPRRALDFAVQLCIILDACGRVPLQGLGPNERVVHGDIKPENIRIENGGRVRLLDFGVAKSVSRSRKFTGHIFGSIPYLSPERLKDNQAGAESDLWSVSIVLYQMLTGQLPHDAESDEDLKDQIRQGRLRQPFLPATLPAQLQPVLARCLEKDPAARYPDAAALKQALMGIDLQEGSFAGGRGGVPTGRTFSSLPQPEPLPVPAPPAPPTPTPGSPFWTRWIERLSATPRARLQQIQDGLRRVRAGVPDRARHFAKAAAGLHEEMERTARQIWIGDAQIELYKERADQLDRMALPLSDLIGEAQKAESEARGLAADSQGLSDALTRDWFATLCTRWATDLERIGVEIRRMAELEDDRDQVQRLREEIRLHGIVLEKLGEADRMVSRLDGSELSKDLGALPHLQEQLRNEGASEAWLARLESLVQPLREAAKQARDPLEEVGKIPALVKELQAWSGQSGEWHREVGDIDRRHRSLGFAPRLPDVEAVLTDARELRERFAQKARALREGQLAGLDQEVKMLIAVAGSQPALEEQLRALRRRQVENPPDHTGWLESFEELRKRFLTTARNQEGPLGEGLARHVEHLHERLRTLRGMPLSAAVRQESENLEDEIRDLTRHPGDGQTLHRLRRTGEIERHLEELRRQAAEGLKELEERENRLLARHAELRAAAGSIEIDGAADLLQRIDALGAAGSLDAAQATASSLDSELEALRSDFAARCRKLLDASMAEATSISQVLERIGRPVSLPAPPRLAGGASPQEAARAAAAGHEIAMQAQQAAEQAFRMQGEILQEARSALGQDHSGVLGPDERRAAEARLADIDREMAEGGRPVTRLERRQRLIEECAPLLGRLHQDQRKARELRDALKHRLERAEAVDLRKFCPELTHRIAGLVYGVADPPWDWQAAQEQLDDARKLLDLAEHHTLRLAAEELALAAQDLWPGQEAPDDDTLLAELRRCPSGALPPWSVRQRVLEARDRRSQARGGRA